MDLYVGIDAGGSRTRVSIVDGSGLPLGCGNSGPANLAVSGKEAGIVQIKKALDSALARLDHSRNGLTIRSIYLGIAGISSSPEGGLAHALTRRLALPAHAILDYHHDVYVALAGGLVGAPGIALIAGTGSVAFGRSASGKETRVGGWGYLIDDPGSAYSVAIHALTAIIRAYDGRGPKTSLTQPILHALDLAQPPDLIRRLYVQEVSRHQLAALAPLVSREAELGDSAAVDILDAAADELALTVLTVARKLLFEAKDTVSVVISGGLARSGKPFQPLLESKIREALPAVDLRPPFLSPVLGAALLSLQQAGIAVSQRILANLRRADSQNLD